MKPGTTEAIRIDNGTLELAFAASDGEGATLRTLRHLPTGGAFSPGLDEDPFWELEFRNEAGYRDAIDSRSGSVAVESEPTGDADLALVWRDLEVDFPDTGVAGRVTFELRVRLPTDGSLSYWRPRADIEVEGATLWRVRLPAFGDLERVGGRRRDDRLVLPDGWGSSVPDPVHADRLFTWDVTRYPTGSMAMQFLAFENGGTGVYLGLHDPDGAPKEFDVDTGDGALTVGVDHEPAGIGGVQTGFDPGYEIALGCYEGDWYDAAQLYRAWAVEDAEWTRRGPIADRPDVPDWFTERAVWFAPGFAAVSTRTDEERQSCDPDDLRATADLVAELDDRIPAPVACHWYHWHEIPYDTSYPEYFPERDGFPEVVSRLQDRDVRVMPYINGRLADPNSEAWRDRDLASAVAANASARCDPPSRSIPQEVYGNGQLLSPMCLTAEPWRETVADLVGRLVDDVGVDGVYIDQLAAVAPAPCFQPDHDHPPAGGRSGVRATRTMLESLSDAHGPETALTSECNADPYVSGLSGHLLWHSAGPNHVPLYQAVYGEYAVAFGRAFFAEDLDGDGAAFASKLGQQFDFGGQLGWFTLPVGRALLAPDNEGLLSYLGRTADALHAGRRFVVTGRRLRDPRPIDAPRPRTVAWRTYSIPERSFELDPLLISAWERPDGAVAVAATNWTAEHVRGTWSLGSIDGVGGDSLALSDLGDSDVAIDPTAVAGEPAIAVDAPPRSTTVAEIVDR